MTPVTLRDVLQPARRGSYAVPGLVCPGWEDARAFALAAQAERAPVILQAGPGARALLPVALRGAILRNLAASVDGPSWPTLTKAAQEYPGRNAPPLQPHPISRSSTSAPNCTWPSVPPSEPPSIPTHRGLTKLQSRGRPTPPFSTRPRLRCAIWAPLVAHSDGPLGSPRFEDHRSALNDAPRVSAKFPLRKQSPQYCPVCVVSSIARTSQARIFA